MSGESDEEIKEILRKHEQVMKRESAKFQKRMAALNGEPKVKPNDYHDAYQGAREDLLDWKRRALEAEAKVREYDQRIVDIGSIAINSIGRESHEAALMRAGAQIEQLQRELDNEREKFAFMTERCQEAQSATLQLREQLGALLHLVIGFIDAVENNKNKTLATLIDEGAKMVYDIQEQA